MLVLSVGWSLLVGDNETDGTAVGTKDTEGTSLSRADGSRVGFAEGIVLITPVG